VEVRNDPARFNYKDALQEWTQRKYKILPKYQVCENKQLELTRTQKKSDKSAQQEQHFVAEVWLKERYLGKGYGRSKKASEQAAAKDAFMSIQKDDD